MSGSLKAVLQQDLLRKIIGATRRCHPHRLASSVASPNRRIKLAAELIAPQQRLSCVPADCQPPFCRRLSS